MCWYSRKFSERKLHLGFPLSVDPLVLGEMQLCICIIKPEARLKRSMRKAIGIF